MKKFFSLYGRTRCQTYWVVTVFLMVTSLIIGGVIGTEFREPPEEQFMKTTFSLTLLTKMGMVNQSFDLFVAENYRISISMALWFIFALWTFLAVTARRLRDAGLSPWLASLSLVPYISFIPWIVWGCLPSEK